MNLLKILVSFFLYIFFFKVNVNIESCLLLTFVVVVVVVDCVVSRGVSQLLTCSLKTCVSNRYRKSSECVIRPEMTLCD